MSSRRKSVTLESLKWYRKQLESSVNVDLKKLAEELFKCGTISVECKNRFATLDSTNLQSPVKVRYLMLHVHDKVKNDIQALKRLENCLSIKFKLQKLTSYSCVSITHREGGTVSAESKIGDYILTIDDETVLTKLLCDAAPKWECIGIVLELSRTVRHNCNSNNCIIALSNILHEWIQGCQEPCKLDTLVRALESEVVGCARVAHKFKESFATMVQTKKSDSLPAIEEESTQCEYGFDYWSDTTDVLEGKSTLLEAQGSYTDTMMFRWSKDGHDLCDSMEFSNTATNILFINEADLIHEGKYKCHMISSDEAEVAVSNEIDLKVNLSTERLHLMSLYSCEPDVPDNFWPPVCNTKYIDLSIMDITESCNPSYRHGATGKNEEIESKNEEIEDNKEQASYTKAFEKFKEKSLILVEGRPGSGKTTLVQRVCKDWATKGSVLKYANLVFFISLRILSDTDKQLSDVLRRLFYRDQTQAMELETVLTNIIERNGKQICFILDGLDEYDLTSKEDTVIYRLIYKRFLPEAMVIVASRPVAIARLMRKVQAITRIEVLGFSDKHVTEYIRHYQFRDSNSEYTWIKLLIYLSAHNNVFQMCYLPVQVAMMCFVFDQCGDKIPHREGKIYENFTVLTLLRYSKRDNYDYQITSLKHLPDKIQESFQKLCKYAFYLTASGKQTLDVDDISDAHTLGLVTLDQSARMYGMKHVYTYHHLTFQEYLAACYVDGLSDDVVSEMADKQTDLIKLHAHKPHMKMVWKFYCSMTGFDKKIHQFETILSSYTLDTIYGVLCAFESQEKLICDYVVQNCIPGVLSFRKAILSHDEVKAIVYVVNTSSFPTTKLEFEECHFVEILPFQFDIVRKKSLAITSISFKYHIFDQSHIFNVILTKVPCLKELDLTGTFYDVEFLTKDVKLCDLRIIRVSDVISPHLYFELETTNRMEQLKCGSSKIEEMTLDMIDLPGQFHELNKYCYLITQENYIKLKLCGIFGFSAYFRGSLPEICLYNANLSIRDFNRIQPECYSRCISLSLINSKINERTIDNLATGLKYSKKLKELHLGFNSLGNIGAEKLAVSLRTHRSLVSFSVLHNNLSDVGAFKLIDSLKNCRRLYYIDMQCNNISHEGVNEITATLEKVLSTFDLKIWNKNLNFQSCSNNLQDNRNTLALKGVQMSQVGSYLPSMLSNQLHVLDMTSSRLSVDSLEEFIPLISLCKNLEDLLLGYNYLSQSEDMVVGLPDIQTLFVNCPKICHLDMSFNCLDSYALNFKEIGLSNLTNLKFIDFSGNKTLFNFQQVEEISRCPNLQTILLNDCDLNHSQVVQILSKCKKIKRIGLGKNDRMVSSIHFIIECLMSLPQLVMLDLNQNQSIGHHILDTNKRMLENIILLEELKTAGNQVNEQTLAFLSIINWNNLHTLDVSCNSIGCADMATFTLGMKYFVTHLDTLYIYCNNITDEGLLAVCDALISDQEHARGSGNKSEISLRTLDISYNRIGDSGILHFIKLCAIMISLDVSHNEISSSGILDLKEICLHFKQFSYNEKKADEALLILGDH